MGTWAFGGLIALGIFIVGGLIWGGGMVVRPEGVVG